MTKLYTEAIAVFFLLTVITMISQKSTHFGSLGFYTGPSIPLGRLALDEVGKASIGRSGSLYGN